VKLILLEASVTKIDSLMTLTPGNEMVLDSARQRHVVVPCRGNIAIFYLDGNKNLGHCASLKVHA